MGALLFVHAPGPGDSWEHEKAGGGDEQVGELGLNAAPRSLGSRERGEGLCL